MNGHFYKIFFVLILTLGGLVSACDMERPGVLHYNSVFLVPEEDKMLGCTDNISIFAGPESGNTDGNYISLSLSQPDSILAGETSGTYLISDPGNNKIHRIDALGETLDFTTETLDKPRGLAFDLSMNLFVSEDSGKIRKFTSTGDTTSFVDTTVAGAHGLFVDPVSDQLYFSNNQDHQIGTVFSNSSTAVFAGSSSGASGNQDGNKVNALFNQPRGLLITDQQIMYVADTLNNSIRMISAGAVSAYHTGVVSPFAMIQDASGNLYVSELNTGKIKKVTPDGEVQSIPLCSGRFAYHLSEPRSIALTPENNLLVVESGMNRIMLVTPDL